MDGILWEPLVNISRTLKRLSCAEQREGQDGLEETLIVSAFSSLSLPVYWQTRKFSQYYSPAIEYLVREYATEGILAAVRQRVHDLSAHAMLRQRVPVPQWWD